MRNVPISQQDIDRLAATLEEVTQGEENENQRTLLSAVIAVVNDVLGPSETTSPLVSRVPDQEAPVVVDVEDDGVPSLRRQFVTGFTSGSATTAGEAATETAEGGTAAVRTENKITGVTRMKISGG